MNGLVHSSVVQLLQQTQHSAVFELPKGLIWLDLAVLSKL